MSANLGTMWNQSIPLTGGEGAVSYLPVTFSRWRLFLMALGIRPTPPLYTCCDWPFQHDMAAARQVSAHFGAPHDFLAQYSGEPPK